MAEASLVLPQGDALLLLVTVLVLLLGHEDGLLLLAVTVLAPLLFFLIGFKAWRHHLETKKPFPDLPMPPNSHWFMGHAKILYGENFPAQVFQIQKESADEHGHTGYWLAGKQTFSVLDLQDARTILLQESYRKTVPILSHYITRVVGDKALILMNGREWKWHRDAVTRTFVPAFLRQAQTQIQQVANDLVDTIHKKVDGLETNYWQIDVQPLLQLATMDVLGKVVFDTDFEGVKTLEDSPIVEAFKYLMDDMESRFQNLLAPWNYFFGLPTEKNRRQKEKVAFLRTFLQTLLSEAKQDSTKKKNCLLSRLVQAHDREEGDTQLDEAIKDVLMTLLFAGYDTTSTTLMYALYLLANHPDIQDRCVDEVNVLSEEKLANPENLPYTCAVVKEALRLYPPGFQTSRTLSKDMALKGGFVAPKGAQVGIPIWIIQRDAALFPRPDECVPERWVQKKWKGWIVRNPNEAEPQSKTSMIAAGNPDALLAFSLGGRSCPGAKFAVQEAVVLLANLVHGLKFKPVPNFELQMKLQGIMPYPKQGMPLVIEKR